MNKTKILSILVPVYNTEKYIKRCLDSLLLDKIKNDIEILVVSDGSKDKSVEIVKEYEKINPQTIVLIEKENGGHGSTINKGIEVATGKYFKVIDSDDWVNSIDFIDFVQRLKNEDADLVVTNYCHEHVYNQKSIFNKYVDLEDNKTYNFKNFDLNLLKGEYFVMATSTYKLEVLKKTHLHLMEKTFYVDMQYNIKPIKNVDTISYYDLDIYRYFIGRKDQSVNTASYVKNKKDHEKVMKDLIEYYENEKENLNAIKRKYIEIILNYMLYTNYTIFTLWDTNNKEAYKMIKNFDSFLKNKSSEMYKLSNNYSFIRAHRKTNFCFVRISGRLFNRLYTIVSKLRRKK